MVLRSTASSVPFKVLHFNDTFTLFKCRILCFVESADMWATLPMSYAPKGMFPIKKPYFVYLILYIQFYEFDYITYQVINLSLEIYLHYLTLTVLGCTFSIGLSIEYVK